MKTRWITAVLLLACGSASADTQEELRFATRLGARGLDEMAIEILDKLEKSRQPDAARAGRYGKALLQKQQASIARLRFLRALDEGKPPAVSREGVLEIYKDAKPKIEDYVNNRQEDLEARFLLGELLQEYAEFLVGANYPEEMKEQREALVSESVNDAEKLFGSAMEHYGEVAARMEKALAKVNIVSFEDTRYLRLSNAQYNRAHAKMRWALLYPGGPKFNYHSDEAIEMLDEFLAEHFEDIFGGYAMLDLGIVYFERGVRTGEEDDAETAVNYFSTLYTTVKEEPTVPETMEVIAKAFYEYAKACNAIARGEGKLKKPRAVYFDNTVRGGAEQRNRLKHGAKHPFALKAMLLVADAYAAQNRFNDAVKLAGETLTTARVEGHRQIANQATAMLTQWVARVSGSGALEASLLLQIGDSLASQDRTGAAITFYEKAMASATDDEAMEKVAYPAMLKIAKEYRRDRRLYAAAKVANKLVDAYLKSEEGEESSFGQLASEACNTSRQSLKAISEATGRSGDERAYQDVLRTFRDKFPGHPENSDAAFTEAKELYNKGKFEPAAKALAEISPSSRNYWVGQRMVPACYRNLAKSEKDAAKAKMWHEKTRDAGRALMKLAESKSDDPSSKKARQYGQLFVAMAEASLENWPGALATIDDYLSRYPTQFLKKGLEYMIKIDAHLALKQLEKAEAALGALSKHVAPTSSILRRSTYNVFESLKAGYAEAPSKATRVAMANRAATLLERWMEGQSNPSYKLTFFYGEVLKDAERYADAASAYEAASDAAPDAATQQGLKLRAAEMQYLAAISDKGLSRKEKIKVLEKTRDLFTDVLIPPTKDDPKKVKQKAILKALGDPAKWPSRETFGAVKRNATALYIAAKIYKDNAPAGIDGRYVALRLIQHLHSFTKAAKDESRPQLDQFIETYWNGAELMLDTYLAIARSGSGTAEKRAAKQGYALAKKLIFQFQSMDGPKRVTDIKALEAQLKVASRG